MAKSPTKAEQILRHAATDMRARDIARAVGCSREYAREIMRRGIDGRNAKRQQMRRKRGQPTRDDCANKAHQRAKERAKPIIEAVEGGCSFTNAALRFGLTRNQVAGMVYRYGGKG